MDYIFKTSFSYSSFYLTLKSIPVRRERKKDRERMRERERESERERERERNKREKLSIRTSTPCLPLLKFTSQ